VCGEEAARKQARWKVVFKLLLLLLLFYFLPGTIASKIVLIHANVKSLRTIVMFESIENCSDRGEAKMCLIADCRRTIAILLVFSQNSVIMCNHDMLLRHFKTNMQTLNFHVRSTVQAHESKPSWQWVVAGLAHTWISSSQGYRSGLGERFLMFFIWTTTLNVCWHLLTYIRTN